MVISTVPDVYDNLHLLKNMQNHKLNQTIIVTAADKIDALRLYEMGADYVLIPNQVGGDFLADMIQHHVTSNTGLGKTGSLKKILASKHNEFEKAKA